MLVVVGGHSRDIGKTSVAAGLIRRLPEYGWTALKISQTGGEACRPAGPLPERLVGIGGQPYTLAEASGPGQGDSGRFLEAGARRAFWVSTEAGELGAAVPEIRKILAGTPYAIVESNSLLEFVEPDLYLFVVDFAAEDFKPSALRYMDRADAFVVVDSGINVPMWKDVSRGVWESKPQFRVKPPDYVSAALCTFVRRRLPAASSRPAR